MEQLSFFLKGLLVGLAVAAPVGPMSVLCVRRCLNDGVLAGLLSGLGIAAADAAYAAAAGFGLASVSRFLLDHQFALRTVGGLALIGIAVRIFFAALPTAEKNATQGTLPGAFLSCFLLTLANPTTILSFLAIFAGLGLVEQTQDYGVAASLVLGVFLGSTLWWVLLTGAIGTLRTRLTLTALVWINRLSAAILLAFGLWALASLLD